MTSVPCCTDDISIAAKILAEGFTAKFSSLGLSDEMTAGLLEDTWERSDNHLYMVNKIDDNIAGAAHLKWNGPYEYTGLSNRDLVQKYGRMHLHRFTIGMNALYEEVDEGDCYIVALAVDEDHRGKGVGATMLDDIADYASDNGFERVTLFVTDKNVGARRLYERSGFRAVRGKQSFFESIYFREPNWTFMARDL